MPTIQLFLVQMRRNFKIIYTYECSEIWHLSIYSDKTKIMIFGTRQDRRFSFKSDRKLYLNRIFMLSQIYANIGSFFTSTNKTTLIKLSKFVAIIMEKFSVKIVFPND